jgi:glutathione S-transferase
MESAYKLYYFNGNGRAVNIRALLSYGKATWEDVKVKHEDWPTLKASGKFDFGQMPGLEVDGKMLTQTLAIEVFLAKRFNLMGSNEEDEYEILNLLSSREDLLKALRPLFYGGLDETQKAALLPTLQTVDLPFFLNIYEKKYVANNGKYYLGDKFTLADIQIVTQLLALRTQYKAWFGDVVEKHCPNLIALVDRLVANELAEFNNNHFLKESQF